MMNRRILLVVALAVLCSTYAFAATIPGAGMATSSQPGTVIHTTGPNGSHCDGDFGAGTGICVLFESPEATDVFYSILLSPNNDVVTGTLGVFEPDGVTLSDTLQWSFVPGNGTFLSVASDPNTFFSIFDATTNEAPCGTGVTEGCLALWNVGNQYIFHSDTPEPSTIMMLGSGLFGAFCFVRRRLT